MLIIPSNELKGLIAQRNRPNIEKCGTLWLDLEKCRQVLNQFLILVIIVCCIVSKLEGI